MTIGEKRHRATEDRHFKIDDTDFGHPHIATTKSDQEPVDLTHVGMGGTLHSGSAKDNLKEPYSIHGDLTDDVVTDDLLDEGKLTEEALTDEDVKASEEQLETI